MKRPAAMIKQEKPTPKKKAREQEPAEAEPAEAELGTEPGEADSQQVADQEPAKAAPASGSKPEKALPAMATAKAKAKAKALAAPSKAQWNDVHYTMKKLEKAGKMDLPEKFKKACFGGHQSKREFYYHTFLLDPEASKKEVHKISLERLSVESTKLRG